MHQVWQQYKHLSSVVGLCILKLELLGLLCVYVQVTCVFMAINLQFAQSWCYFKGVSFSFWNGAG